MGPRWPQKSDLEGHVGLQNRSWRASWGGLGAILAPRAKQDPPGWDGGPPRTSLGPPSWTQNRSSWDQMAPKLATLSTCAFGPRAENISKMWPKCKGRGPRNACPANTEHSFSVSGPECSWKPTSTLLGSHWPPKMVPSWFQEGPSWPQVGAKLAPRNTQEPLENDHKTSQKRPSKKGWSKSTHNARGILTNPWWGP